MQNIGQDIYNFATKIFPYFRSITGEGVRQTLKDIKNLVEPDGCQLHIHSVPSGTQVFDWVVPKEWVIRDAYIEDDNGRRIIDAKVNNLHVLGYSCPVDRWVSLDELQQYVYTEEDDPNVIPYVTSYYKDRYGFCMSRNMLSSLPKGRYHMYIDSKHVDGQLNYGEIVIPGQTSKEVFFSTYICHPSMANNECSGPALSAYLVKHILAMARRKYTYRFVYLPETIGSIAYLSQGDNLKHLQQVMLAGFNLSCVGDDRDYSIIESKYADTLSDKVLKNILKFKTNDKYTTYSFLDRGSDEKQYNAVGVDLPVVCFCRSKFGMYPEYHTSADNMGLVSPSGFQGSYDVMVKVIEVIENNDYFKMNVICDPQLGKRGLYPNTSRKGIYDNIHSMMNFIAYADGKNDLVDISNKIGVPVSELLITINKLREHRLI